MTPKQVDRAKVLRDALAGLPTIRKWSGHRDASENGLWLQVHKFHPYITSVRLDKVTGRMVLAIVEGIIRAELKALGVRLPKRAKLGSRT